MHSRIPPSVCRICNGCLLIGCKCYRGPCNCKTLEEATEVHGPADETHSTGNDTIASSDNGEQSAADTARPDIRGGHGSKVEQLWRECASDGAPIGAPPASVKRSIPRFARVIPLIFAEIDKGEEKHGKLPASIQRSMLILQEEVGELTMEVVDCTRGDKFDPAYIGKLGAEAVQVAAVAIRIIENILQGRTEK